MPDNYEFLLGLRAIRDYEQEPIAPEHLTAILEAGRWTGSSKNDQAWSFIAVTDRGRLDALADCGTFTQPIRDSMATIVVVQEAGGNMFDIGRAVQNMMLAAKAVGVASCPVTLHRDAQAAAFLGLPQGPVARYAISLGYPAPDAAPRRFGGRKPSAEVIKYDAG